MNSNWLKTVLIISLVLNCMVAGGLTYKYFFVQKTEGQTEKPLKQDTSSIDFPPQIRNGRRGFGNKIRPERMRIQEEQDKLVELLMREPPDRRMINEALETISRTQAEVQRLTVDRILKEIQNLPPEQKVAYIAKIKRRMRHKGMFGMGRGRHKGGGWRKKGNTSPGENTGFSD